MDGRSGVEEAEMTNKPDLLTAHCSLIHGLNTAWLELWSKPNIDAKDLKPNMEAVGRYAAALDVIIAKYREACYATAAGGEK